MTSGDPQVPAEILGLPLPLALRAAMAENRWTAPDRGRLEAIFGDEAKEPCFYTARGMEHETRILRDDPWMQEPYFLGTPPYDIDPRRCLLIGDLDRDQPFALDYRRSLTVPHVLYLHPTGWIEVAHDADTLITKLGIDRARPQVS